MIPHVTATAITDSVLVIAEQAIKLIRLHLPDRLFNFAIVTAIARLGILPRLAVVLLDKDPQLGGLQRTPLVGI